MEEICDVLSTRDDKKKTSGKSLCEKHDSLVNIQYLSDKEGLFHMGGL